tara:strand:- start:3579 stop:3878 length:300 start_codon:yes stop_codon:yes gene_type:complete
MGLDHQAIYKAYPNATSVSDTRGVFDKDGNKITIVQSDVDTARATLDTEAAAVKYKKDRADVYPSLQEQFDLQYWDKVNGTTKWQEAIAKVKSDYPKPS